MSGLEDLTREELVALVLKLDETVQAQAARIAELEAIVQRQAERISELEEEVVKLRGSRPVTWNLEGQNTFDACREMLVSHNKQTISAAT